MSLKHTDDEYETPPWLFDHIKRTTGLEFVFDAAATQNNTKCKWFPVDGLSKIWITPAFCNPPRSINGKFVEKALEQRKLGVESVLLLCWNDLGNKYCDELRELMGRMYWENIGKVKFYKNGKESGHFSRLTYFWIWLK